MSITATLLLSSCKSPTRSVGNKTFPLACSVAQRTVALTLPCNIRCERIQTIPSSLNLVPQEFLSPLSHLSASWIRRLKSASCHWVIHQSRSQHISAPLHIIRSHYSITKLITRIRSE